MQEFKLTTDSCCDEYKTILAQEDIGCIAMPYITDQQYYDNYSKNEEYKHFYDEMRRGVMPTTAALSPAEIEEFFEKQIAEGHKSILHIVLSSGLSLVYENSVKAAQDVMKRNAGVEIYVPNVKAATQGQNLLLQIAKDMRNQGKSAKATYEHLMTVEKNLHQWLFITDLMHLKRGGRIGSAAAAVGTILKARPILVIDENGKLAVVEKTIGTKRAIKALAEKVEDYGLDLSEQTIYICHSDDLHSAEILKQLLVKRIPRARVIINFIGPVIGSHTGPDTVGVVFLGKERYSAKQKKQKSKVKEKMDDEVEEE